VSRRCLPAKHREAPGTSGGVDHVKLIARKLFAWRTYGISWREEHYAARAELYFRQFVIDYYTPLALEIPKNEARLVNTDSMRNCINWR
jgi:hypothetical protein